LGVGLFRFSVAALHAIPLGHGDASVSAACVSLRAMPTLDSPEHPTPNQFALLGQRRFGPFFWVQFLNAGNDNLFKFAFTVMVTYQLQVAWLPATQAGLVIGALFILPYVLFSATSGQLADQLPKERLMRFVKSGEIAIMAVAAWGFIVQNVPTLLACVFLMGLHSTLFGPVKYAYLPQHLTERELTGGNGMVEMGTFTAILLGQVAGGLLIAIPGQGAWLVAVACVAVAVLGRVVAQALPHSPATDPGLRINWNPFSETWRNLRLAHASPVVFRSLLGISWMWFFGAVFLNMFPAFARDVLHGDERVASLLLVLFSVGVGAGSLLCEVLNRRHADIGLVPLGAIGMSLFAVDLYFAARGLPPSPLQGLAAFVAQPAHWRVMADLLLLSLFAGIYSVPMYALIQLRCPPTHRARIIAANNILNALFMIVSSVGVGLLLSAGFSIPEVFGLVGLLNAVVAGCVFLLVPEYLLRFAAFVLTRLLVRLQVRGDHHIPLSGPAMLVGQPAGALDALLLISAIPRPLRVLTDPRSLSAPGLGRLLRLGQALVVAPPRAGEVVDEAALSQARRALDAGELLCVFSVDGATGDCRAAIEQLLQTRPVPVIAMALVSGAGPGVTPTAQAVQAVQRPAGVSPSRGLFSERVLVCGPALSPGSATPEALREHRARWLAP
jgi:MFS family permease